MSRNKLYTLWSAACIAGYIWLILNYHRSVHSIEPGLCLFKRVTGIPCPSCGSTRSVLSMLNGDFMAAIRWNPFGILLTMLLLLAPFWILYDLVLHNDSLFRAYNRSELLLKKKWIALPLILLVLMNWIWNITKGL